MDALGGHRVHRGVIPVEHRKPFYRSVAECHVRVQFDLLVQDGSLSNARSR
jgi:hypothetical protein